MKRIERILVPTDLSENSRRGLLFGCSLAEENKADLIVLHVANDFQLWELFSEEFDAYGFAAPAWPADRVMAEAALDLNRFLENHLEAMKRIPHISKRTVLGSVPHKIAQIAEEERADLIVMCPRRHRRVKHLFTASITERVTRTSPCPVLAVTPPLPSQPWRGRLAWGVFGWPGQKVASA